MENFLAKLQELQEWETKVKMELGKFFSCSPPRKNIHGIPWSFSWLEVNFLSTCIESLAQKKLLARPCFGVCRCNTRTSEPSDVC
jgi:hypothetical protein